MKEDQAEQKKFKTYMLSWVKQQQGKNPEAGEGYRMVLLHSISI